MESCDLRASLRREASGLSERGELAPALKLFDAMLFFSESESGELAPALNLLDAALLFSGTSASESGSLVYPLRDSSKLGRLSGSKGGNHGGSTNDVLSPLVLKRTPMLSCDPRLARRSSPAHGASGIVGCGGGACGIDTGISLLVGMVSERIGGGGDSTALEDRVFAEEDDGA